MANEDDPKHVAAEYRKLPSTERTLRQFLTLESCNANNRKFIDNYDLAMKGDSEPVDWSCSECDFEARTMAEAIFHCKMVGHDSWIKRDNK